MKWWKLCLAEELTFAQYKNRWCGGLEANQFCLLKGRNTIYKFYWCGNKSGIGGAGFLLASKWIENVFDVQ